MHIHKCTRLKGKKEDLYDICRKINSDTIKRSKIFEIERFKAEVLLYI